jgi:hypothetical protein
MKMKDLLPDAGRPVAYYARLRRLTGSTNATLFLCQLLYWQGKQRDRNGWIIKRSSAAADDPEGRLSPLNQSIQEETGLTYKEQKAARRILRARGFLHECQNRLRHLMYFKLDLQAIEAAWKRTAAEQDGKAKMANKAKPRWGIGESHDGELGNATLGK